ncbi:MAG: hypothetical protein A3B96_01535 [Candidatus Spechtbacteria bacterium RIFCSPHIGHO2_02_FULL_43_15b]|uniref:Solute-binding protein family 5 domain-containing protein n=1 Tax=Candidatus Spechtbacteria bacterium RIFCSPHIGHO2_01_FULL_43_30 TaxID=1802158 RepID=A0A1G2H7Q1_9BACT|nr:MAG: hypothetical protein A2827_01445 [Candidatus Spechtbacteria bacterium RIFCSPHIGHO2_01_FULL_43_30]OGZ60443.1 MAG: hypothetical protein A3B96_01535 [Candidatus Spechtbacteria bacterium RIFCSPHIGHO2_02_FULL_43_15b]
MKDLAKVKRTVNINKNVLIRSLNVKEKSLISFFVMLILASMAAIGINFYFSHTEVVPARGGSHIEAMLGIPRFVNSALSQISDTDRDISHLIYSGLMKYDKDGKIVEDLAESYVIEENRIYKFKLRSDALWHDGQKLTADDVIFTIKLIQDPKYASPIRQNWQGVEVEKQDENTIVFKLISPYSPFLENATVGILPKHIWENSSPNSFPHADANLQPIGSGPYKFEKFQKDSSGNIKSYTLKINDKYYGSTPNIEGITFKFFDSEDEALQALRNGDVSAMSFVSGFNNVNVEKLKNVTVRNFSLPRYFAVFFNQAKSKPLSEKAVREALSYATNREEIIQEAAGGKGSPAFGPIVKELLGYNPQIEQKYEFSVEKAEKSLDSAGWIDSDGDGVREKKIKNETEPTKLEVKLITVQWPELEKVLRVLENQWEKVGVSVNIEAYSLGEIQQEFIRPREYEAIVFGQVVGIDPDPFSFWHSSQKKDPGLNISLYENKTVDKLLEEARQTLDSNSRVEKYVLLQDYVSQDIPAIFLYSPSYLYPINRNIKGIKEGKIADPSWRFADVERWYMTTKRVWK